MQLRQNAWLSNAFYLSVGKAVAFICVQLLDICLARWLSIEDYAEWVFFFSVLSILFFICYFGINNSARIHISNTEFDEDKKNAFRAGFKLRCVVSFFFSFSVFIFSLFDNFRFFDAHNHFLVMLRIGSFVVFVNSIMDYLKVSCQSIEAYKTLCLATVVENLANLFFVIFFLKLSSIKFICFGYGVSYILVIAFLVFSLKNYGFSFEKNILEKQLINKIFIYAIPLALTDIGVILLSEVDIIMLRFFGSEMQTATYSIGKHICDKAIHVNYILFTATIISVANITKENSEVKIRQLNKIKKYNVCISFGVSILLLFIAVVAIPIFYGKKYHDATNVMISLVPYYFLYGISSLYSQFLDFRGKALKRCIVFIICIIANAIGDYFFIPMLGAYGAAMSTILALLVFTIFVVCESKKVVKKIIHGE